MTLCDVTVVVPNWPERGDESVLYAAGQLELANPFETQLLPRDFVDFEDSQLVKVAYEAYNVRDRIEARRRMVLPTLVLRATPAG